MSTTNSYTTWIYRSVVIFLLVGTIGWLGLQYQARVEEAYRTIAQTHYQSLETEARALLTSEELVSYEPSWQPLLVTCPDGVTDRFDPLLGQLGTGLTASELQFLATHASRCTGDFARKQQLRASRLNLLVQEMTRVSDMHFTTDLPEDVASSLAAWQALVPLEISLGEQYDTMVTGQRNLILARLAGESVSGPVVSQTLARVSAARASSSDTRARRTEMYGTLDI